MEAVAGSRRSSVSRKKTAPAFSIAPASKSGTATRSSFPYGYGMPKYSSSRAQRLGRRLEPDGRQVPLPRDVPDADRGGAEPPLGRRLERPDGDGEEVRRERRRLREVDDAAAAHRLLALDRRVGDDDMPVLCRHRDAEARLEARLVEARQDAAGVGRLALRERVAAVVGGDGVEAA
jgi:hypothetical protein